MNPKHDAPASSVWRKSSYSGGGGGNCIEIAESPENVRVRDSKDKTGPVLAFTQAEWAEFVGFARTHTV